MDRAIKAAVQTLPRAVVLWVRFAFHLAIVIALLVARGRSLPSRTHAPTPQAARSVCLAAANFTFSVALIHVPLAQPMAIGVVSPLLTTLLDRAPAWRTHRVAALDGACRGLRGRPCDPPS